MKKQFRIAILMDAEDIEFVYHLTALAYGRENVAASPDPRDVFGLLRKLRPTTLIIDPSLFDRFNIGPKDINAFRSRIHYHVIAVYPNEESLASRKKYRWLYSEKDFITPVDYMDLIREIPTLSKNKYVFRRAKLVRETRENIDRIFADCGFRCDMKGAKFLKEALFRMYFNPDLHRNGGATKLYREFAEKYETTPRIVERSILRCLENSWTPQTEESLRKELNVPDSRDFLPLNFRHFTKLFNTYYTIKYRDPKSNLKTPQKLRY